MAGILTRYELVKGEDGWELTKSGRLVALFSSKDDALDPNNGVQRVLDEESGGEGTVYVHAELGGVDEERTYPRSTDPHKSPG